MTFDRRRSELRARSTAPPRFTQQSTMTNLLNLTHTTRPQGCRSLARRRRCSSVEDSPGIFSLLTPCRRAKSQATHPFLIYLQALNTSLAPFRLRVGIH